MKEVETPRICLNCTKVRTVVVVVVVVVVDGCRFGVTRLLKALNMRV